MGKRKGRADQNKTTNSDLVPQSSHMDALPQQKSSLHVEITATTPISSAIEVMEDSVNLPQSSLSPAHNHQSSRAMLLKNPRYCSRKYFRRKSTNQTHASSSRGKVISSHDEKLVAKLVDTERFSQPFRKPEKIRTSSVETGAISHDAGRMVCGICVRPLRKKPLNFFSSSISTSEPSVVAVLVCGHLYHADCLEQKTCQEERMDPPCPLCISM